MLVKEQRSMDTSAHNPVNTSDERQFFDIALISPPSRMINHYRPPVGLMYVAGYLQKNGLAVKIIDVPMKNVVRNKEFQLNLSDELKKIENSMLDEFKKIKTRLVGIAFYTPEYSEVFDLARSLKKIDPAVKIVVGGIHPTFYPQEVLSEKDCPIDFCVIGDGEITAYELVKAINERKDDLSSIAGIAYFDKQRGEVIITKPRQLCDDLDQVSYPAYDLIDMDYYTNASPYAIRGCFLRCMYILATRGCPSQCTFCVAKKLRDSMGSGTYCRWRSADSLINELKGLKDTYNIDSFWFVDDLFTLNKKLVFDFCDGLKKNRLGLLWGCSSKVSTLDEEIIRKMAESGCIQIDFGVERGSDKALKSIKKGITVEKIVDVFSLCHKYDVRTFANFLVNLPHETEEDLNDILMLARILKSEIVSFNIFTPYPGTEIYDSSSNKFSKEEYGMLTHASDFIYTRPERFKFSDHNINIIEWAQANHKTYNPVFKNLMFYFSARYLGALLRSKNKTNYLRQSGLLVRELINQKL
ncbi:MAG: B12-binding domain-containing radical SAM protein [Candidatus Omnitrophica bacterium]|nr:B12-binding domain-containing radical SAM protein [Candidatus Omnitrophota bacterium]